MQTIKFRYIYTLLLVIFFIFSITAGSYDLQYLKLSKILYSPLQAEADVINGGGLSQNYQKVQSDGSLELYYRTDTSAIAVLDVISGKVWYSSVFDNPALTGAKGNFLADELILNIHSGNQNYFAGSNDKSRFKISVQAQSESGLVLNYAYTKDKTHQAVIRVSYYLKDNSLYAEADTSQIVNTEDFKVTGIFLLKGMGTVKSGADNYFFVPDGSGAIIDLGDKTSEDLSIELDVYGKDKALTHSKEAELQNSSVLFPVYGVKDANEAFLAVIESGDAIAKIHASRSKGGDFHSVFPVFEITSSDIKEVNAQKTLYLSAYQQNNFKGTIKIAFRFLSQSSANYAGMAIACREQFFRNGTLSLTESEPLDSIPLVLNLIGKGYADQNRLFLSGGKRKVLTGFSDAQLIAERAVSKGIADLDIRYLGAINGGLYQNSLDNIYLEKDLGSEKELSGLLKYLEENKMKLYTDISFVNASGISPQKAARFSALSLYGKPAATYNQNVSDMDFDFISYLRAPSGIKGLIDKFIMKEAPYLNNISVNDLGRMLYADYNAKSPFSKEETKKEFINFLDKLSIERGIMVNTGNAYSLKKADIVVNQPFDTTFKAEGYSSIPFVQMVLHGSTLYCGEPINLSEDYKKAMLKSIEYGALPSFTFTFSQKEYAKAEVPDRSNLDYTAWLNIAADYYTKASETLLTIYNKRFLNDTEITPGVFCSEYEDVKIYVNYNDTQVTVDSLTIPPLDWALKK